MIFLYEMFILQLEKAYDKLMMAQLTNRKKGLTFGSFKVHGVMLYFQVLRFCWFEVSNQMRKQVEVENDKHMEILDI